MRAIDRNEPAILATLAVTDRGAPLADAVRSIAPAYGLTPARLAHLVAVWCAVAGIAPPRTADPSTLCPHCGEPVEPTGTGWYRHTGPLTGPCGIRLMDSIEP